MFDYVSTKMIVECNRVIDYVRAWPERRKEIAVAVIGVIFLFVASFA